MDAKGCDDEELIELLAEARLTHRQIAERLGIAPALVAAIARGSQRPELQEPIAMASGELLRHAHRLVRAYAWTLASIQIREALGKKESKKGKEEGKEEGKKEGKEEGKEEGKDNQEESDCQKDDAIARKAREFLLDRLLPKGPSGDVWLQGSGAEPSGPAPPDLPGLTAEDLEWIAQRHGGPEE